jgi:plasmid maintenance system killer protein
MIEIIFAPVFVSRFKRLEPDLQEEALGKVDLFHDRNNHKVLKVHKLKGKFAGLFSFSVNFKTRIIFEFTGKNEVSFLDIGDHDIYK